MLTIKEAQKLRGLVSHYAEMSKHVGRKYTEDGQRRKAKAHAEVYKFIAQLTEKAQAE